MYHYRYFLVVLLVLFFVERCAYAQVNPLMFEIYIENRVLQQSEEFFAGIQSKYGIVTNDTRFKIRPVITGCVMQVYNSSYIGNTGWIFSTSTWSAMPYLSSNVKLRLLNCDRLLSELFFVVSDTMTGEVFNSNSVFVYTDGEFIRDYVRAINSVILRE